MALIAKFWVICLLTVFASTQIALSGPYILVDMNKREVIAADRATDPWYPASITKLMTLYVAANAIRDGRLSMASSLTMSKYAVGTAPSKMGFKVGTKITMENAFAMLIVKSANDIAVGIAERVSGSEEAFIREMNDTARKLGMTGSHFTNPHGLPSQGQYVTARDMAVLGLALQNDFPELAPLFGVSAIRHGKRVLRSFNLLLEHYRGATGMKTGFICAAGLNMVASAKRGKKRYLAVILGEPSTIDRTEKAALVLEHGFQNGGKESKGRLAHYLPSPTRAKPVNLRPYICGGHRKIRQYQIVTPQPKPKKKFFGKNKYISPQRKDFGPSLGNPTHPQGTLVFAPRGRTYRSHILQPRQKREILTVHAGADRQANKPLYTVHISKQGRKRLARQSSQVNGLTSIGNGSEKSGTPFPLNKPSVKQNIRAGRSSPSAYANSQNGRSGQRSVKGVAGNFSLYGGDVLTGQNTGSSNQSVVLDLKPALSILEPRPNPSR